MKRENTRQKILDTALGLFAKKGYDAVSVGEIAEEVGIKAPSIYNHFGGKQEIFDAIVETTAERYAHDTDKFDIHVESAVKDFSLFKNISEEALYEKVKQIFEYSLHDKRISDFRKMMTIEQFRSDNFGELYTKRFVDRLVNYHAVIFSSLISAGTITGNADALALMYVAPIITLVGICDRQPEREAECLEKLEKHVALFYYMSHHVRHEKHIKEGMRYETGRQ